MSYPAAEIIRGIDDGTPFSKAAAVNHAASLARGQVFCVLDADTYLRPDSLTTCVDKILTEQSDKRQAWYMPYTRHYRLNEQATLDILKSSPAQPLTLPPADSHLDPAMPSSTEGHRFGAMAQVMPREAFDLVHGMDPEFRGWGGEDGAFLKSLDTLYCQHEVASGDLVHFWHDRIMGDRWTDRKWVGQNSFGVNRRREQRYTYATGEPALMRALCDEHPLGE